MSYQPPMHPLGPTPCDESTATTSTGSPGSVVSLRYSMIPVLIVMWCTSVWFTSTLLVSWDGHFFPYTSRTWLFSSSGSDRTMAAATLPQPSSSRILSKETILDDTTTSRNTKDDNVQVGAIDADYTTTPSPHPPPPSTMDSTTNSTPTMTKSKSNNNNNNKRGGPWSATQWFMHNNDDDDDDDDFLMPVDRCDWLWNEFEQHNSWMTHDQRVERYQQQVTDPSSYYRATSHIFWIDFVHGNWSQVLLGSHLKQEEEEREGFNEYATYTWVSGDLHLLNLGAWKNRHGDVVFGMNDFDEGAVHDFQLDLVRLAISIHDQIVVGVWNNHDQGAAVAGRIIRSLVRTYVNTVMTYVGNENAFVYELTPKTAAGPLKHFLKKLRDDKKEYSRKAQIKKYAEFKNGQWKFKKGTKDNPKKKLAQVSIEMEESIRRAFSPTGYGATVHKFGGGALPSGRWNDNFFEVLDVAARIGSGVGSYGVDRYYVLIRGESTEDDTPTELGPVILDVKYQPPGSFRHVVTSSDAAWYDNYFVHSAARVSEAQRKLTAFTDPFTGWILLDSDQEGVRPFTVRERSPWKESFDLETLESEQEYAEFMAQVAFTTATSHVRGNVAPVPEDFKNMITRMFKDSSRLDLWSQAIVDLAAAYHDQIQLDFECFQSQVNAYYT